MTRKEFDGLNINACKALKEENGKHSSSTTVEELNDFILSKLNL